MDLTEKDPRDEALDLVAEFINQLGHVGIDNQIRSWSQTQVPYKKILEHPAFVAAEKRRKDQFWARLDAVARQVDAWPDWMKPAELRGR